MSATQDVPLLNNPQQRSIQKLLLNYGVSPRISRSRAQAELRNFSTSEILSTFGKLHRHGENLKNFEFDPASPTLISSLKRLFWNTAPENTPAISDMWLKPPLELVKMSANSGLALCVNAAGDWSLREDGYYALSHVWVEGIQADPHNRGMPMAHFHKIMKKVEQCDAEWIWLDGLAIPGSSRALTLEEEEIKIAIINNLHLIYRRARSIIVLDAMVMQLESTDLMDVALCLICGKWMTRVWTYQEIYLSRKAIILTATGMVEYLDIVARLRSLSGNDNQVPELFFSMTSQRLAAVESTKKDPQKYNNMYLLLVRNLSRDGKKPSLTQMALSCQDRETGNDIDYARAFFPVLGLKWKGSFTREEGMKLIYDSQTYYSKRMILMHGSPKSLEGPGWAPSYLTGLMGHPLGPDDPLGDIEYQSRGLKRDWYTYKVNVSHPTKMKDGLFLEIESQNTGVLCGCITSNNERSESIEGFKKAISNKSAYILANEELLVLSKYSIAYKVLLVERNEEMSSSNEGWIYLTAEVLAVQKSLVGKRESWLILHENPISDSQMGGKLISKIRVLASDEDALHKGQTSLHAALKSSDEKFVLELIRNERELITARDEKGWMPLHTAAHVGKDVLVRLLIEHGARIDVLDNNARTPLMIAASEGHTQVVEILLVSGADPNFSNRNALCPLNQALVGSHVKTIKALLDGGASPHRRDQFGFAPMLIAASKSVEITNLLLSAGAEPSADLVGGSAIVHFASRNGNTAVIKRLLELGVPVDLTEGGDVTGFTSLYRAVEEQREGAVDLLLEHGANANHVVDSTWSCTLLAAKIGNYNIMKALVKNGANFQTVCQPEKWTALHIACHEGHRLVARLLLDAGWDINARDSEGRTPLKLAAEAKNDSLIDLLMNSGGI